MESPHGTLRDNGIDITSTVVLPPLTASNLGGNPEIVSYVEKNLRAGGIPAKVAQPEMIAQVVLEAIENDSLWANPTVEKSLWRASAPSTAGTSTPLRLRLFSWPEEPTLGPLPPAGSSVSNR